MLRNGDGKPAVFLDRDGVINKTLIRDGKPFAPTTINDLQLLEGVAEAVNILQDLDLELIIVTNQPDVARGVITQQQLAGFHEKISRETGLRHFYACIHEDEDRCDCRKPKTGLLRAAATDLDVNFEISYMVGDRWKDIQAGQELGCSCFFIDYQYSERRPLPPFSTVTSLLEAAIRIKEITHEKQH